MMKTRYWTSILCFLILSCDLSGSTFPIESFKQFVNENNAVEGVDFDYSVPLRTGGHDSDEPLRSTRSFHVAYENSSRFLTTETHESSDREVERTFRDPFYGSKNPRQIRSDVADRRTARATVHNRRIANQLLKLGLPNVGTNAVQWNGSNFLCASNEIGARLSGTLTTDNSGQPISMRLEIFYKEQHYPYEIAYEFDASDSRPDFFPSRITLRYLGQRLPQEVADFTVKKLQLQLGPQPSLLDHLDVFSLIEREEGLKVWELR